MKAIILTAAILMTTCLLAQENVTVYVVENQIQPPVEEWYVIEDDKYGGTIYMDFEDSEHAIIQIDATLAQFDTSFDSGTTTDLGDGFFYMEWDGMWVNENGDEVPVYFTYMFSENNPNFHRISYQAMD